MGATILGSVNLQRYCQRLGGLYAVVRFPNTWGWRCAPSPTQASGDRLGDLDVSVSAACIEQYGQGTVPHYRNYADPDSWFCYRP